MGKNAGDDLREGKPTLPLIYLLDHGTPEQKSLIRTAIEQAEELPEDLFQQVYQAIINSDAIQYTEAAALRESQLARESLKRFPQNIATQSLMDLCDYSLKRSS
jgi:octaprenyl-diphosphate synthase